MIKHIIINTKNKDTWSGKTMEEYCQNINENEIEGEIVPLIYTERKDGVLDQYNIKVDKFKAASESMKRVNKIYSNEIQKKINNNQNKENNNGEK